MGHSVLAAVTPRRIATAAVLAICFAMIYVTVDFTGLWTHLEEGTLGAVLRWIKANPQWGLLIIGALAFGESMPFLSLILPFWVILVAAGPVLVALGYSFWAVVFASGIGAALGDWLAYTIGYFFKDRVRHWYPFSKHPGLLDKGHAFFAGGGGFWGMLAIIIARFSGPLRATVPVVAGIAEMPWLKFQIANFGSAILWAYVLLGGGTLFTKLF